MCRSGDAFVQHDSIDRRVDRDALGGGRQGRDSRWAGPHAVGPSEREMGPERPALSLPARIHEAVVEPTGQPGESVGAVGDAEPQGPRTIGRWEGSRAGDPDPHPAARGGGGADRSDDVRQASLGRRTEEAERDVDPLEPHPANAATLRLGRADGLDQRLDPASRRLVEGDCDEESRRFGQRWTAPSTASRSRRQFDRSATRTSRARSASRQPSTSVSLASRSL